MKRSEDAEEDKEELTDSKRDIKLTREKKLTFAWLFFVLELLDLGISINRICFKLVRNFAKGMVRSLALH